MEWYLKVVRDNYANFNGRARRKEYWMFILFNIIIGIVLSIIDNLLGLKFGQMNSNGILGSIYQLVIFIPALAVATRRLHDVNKSGWHLVIFYALIALIVGASITMIVSREQSTSMFMVISLIAMVAYGIFIFVLSVTNGDTGSNQYGPDPKGNGELNLEDHLI